TLETLGSWQMKREDRTNSLRRILELELPLHGFGKTRGQEQSETNAAGPHRHGVLESMKPFEYVVTPVGRDAWSVVPNAYSDRALVSIDRHFHRGICCGVAARIVDQRVEDLDGSLRIGHCSSDPRCDPERQRSPGFATSRALDGC